MNGRMGRLVFLAALIAFWAAPALRAEEAVAAPPLVDLTTLLPPPPGNASDATRAEVKEILQYQKHRTPAMVAAAQADQDLTVFRFADVLGEGFTAEKLPETAAFFAKALEVSESSVQAAKAYWKRPRPYTLEPKVRPCLKMPPNDAYPSGHSTGGTLFAVLLGQMVPEKRGEIMERGWAFALNRVVGGVHYRSDVEAGRIAGTVLALELLKDPAMKASFESARKELRGALGYQP